MPSNKKKSKVIAAKSSKEAPPTVKSLDSPEKLPLNVTRWTMLILLAVGISKLLDVRNASIGNPSATCSDFLGEEVCQDNVVSNLLRYKFQSALGVLLLTLAATLECISSDRMLQLLQGVLAVSFMFPAGVTLWASKSWIPSSIVWQQLMVLAGLSLVAIPSRDSIPFFVAKNAFPRGKSLQSLTLLSLAFLSLVGCSQIILPILLKGDSTGVLKSLATQTTSVTAVTPILLFFGVDKLASAGIYAFSWYYFTNEQQRVS